jgi:hypothetical protein
LLSSSLALSDRRKIIATYVPLKGTMSGLYVEAEVVLAACNIRLMFELFCNFMPPLLRQINGGRDLWFLRHASKG